MFHPSQSAMNRATLGVLPSRPVAWITGKERLQLGSAHSLTGIINESPSEHTTSR